MIRGTSYEQDSRFPDKDKRMLEKSQWPDKYDIKIDLAKVDFELIKLWIDKKVTQLLGEEDDVVTGTINSLLEDCIQKEEKPVAKKIHVALSGFLQDKTLTFMSELWDILDEAQKSSRGIPECLIEQKTKREQEERKKLADLKTKKDRLKSNKFDHAISRHQSRDYRRQSSHSKERRKSHSRQRKRTHSRQFERRKKSHKKHKKYDGSSEQKVRKDRKRRDRSRSDQKRRKRGPPSHSESSSVVSSQSQK